MVWELQNSWFLSWLASGCILAVPDSRSVELMGCLWRLSGDCWIPKLLTARLGDGEFIMGAMVQLCAWSLEAPGCLGIDLHCKSRDTEMVLRGLGQEQEGLGRVGRIAWVGCDAVGTGVPDLSQKQAMWDVFSLRECEGLFRAHCGYQSHGDSGSGSLANLVEAMELNWWPVVLHDLLVVGNLFSDRLYNGTEIFLAGLWRAISIVPCLWVYISVYFSSSSRWFSFLFLLFQDHLTAGSFH